MTCNDGPTENNGWNLPTYPSPSYGAQVNDTFRQIDQAVGSGGAMWVNMPFPYSWGYGDVPNSEYFEYENDNGALFHIKNRIDTSVGVLYINGSGSSTLYEDPTPIWITVDITQPVEGVHVDWHGFIIGQFVHPQSGEYLGRANIYKNGVLEDTISCAAADGITVFYPFEAGNRYKIEIDSWGNDFRKYSYPFDSIAGNSTFATYVDGGLGSTNNVRVIGSVEAIESIPSETWVIPFTGAAEFEYGYLSMDKFGEYNTVKYEIQDRNTNPNFSWEVDLVNFPDFNDWSNYTVIESNIPETLDVSHISSSQYPYLGLRVRITHTFTSVTDYIDRGPYITLAMLKMNI
jgi:hypothetical protein